MICLIKIFMNVMTRGENMIIGAIIYTVVILFSFALCKSAKMADERMEEIMKGD